ncbi:MAG: hypothetical protein ABEI86_03595, partial [Halobacteriaceae archaeon]
RSSGEEQFWINDEKAEVDQCPDDLYIAVKTSLERLEKIDKEIIHSSVSEHVQSRLEQLGYR